MSVLQRFALTGRLAVVTGAGRGIGAAIAVALAEAGADVVGISRGPADATARAIEAVGRRYRHIGADLGSRADVRRALDEVLALPRPVDVLVNNAGIAERNPAEHHSDDQWDRVLEVDLTTPFVLARELGAGMLERGSGKIVFLASMMSFQGGRNVIGYAASKSGIAGVVHALANEWSERGVQVNAVAPGYIETELTVATHADPQRRAAFQQRIPAGRWGSPDDVAAAVVFLASPAADYISGAVLPVDGGWLVR